MDKHKLSSYGIGIRVSTYFILLYPIYADYEQKYGVLSRAVFGMN